MGVVYGWACALVGAMALATAQPFHFEFFLLLAGVSLNLVILVHFHCRITRSTSRFRRYHLACVGLCLLLTWTYFALDKTELLIGHYLWAAGAILITSADLLLPGHPRGAP
ncbi:hypothetical protein [uncultured Paludibaculum sp.]|uniref:hypothetical protein n=1 Tax=uncultured Paludibaculum sp. TaxID=1765020 RepID=UPI00374DAB95